MDPQICDAIENKRLLAFNYNGLPREIEPHAHGISLAGKEVVRGYQTGGHSSSEPLGWRLWMWRKWNRCEYASLPSPAPAPNIAGMTRG